MGGTDPEMPVVLSDIVDPGVPLEQQADEFHSMSPAEVVSDQALRAPSSAPPPQDPLDFATQSASSEIQRAEDKPASGAWGVGPSNTVPAPSMDAPPPSAGNARAGTPLEVLGAARSRFELDDFDGALDLLEQIPDRPELSANEVVRESRRLKDQIEDRLQKVYEAKGGAFDRRPAILVGEEQLIWMNMNHRVGYILSQVDGNVTYDDLVSLSGMPRIDTLRILVRLIDEGVIGSPRSA